MWNPCRDEWLPSYRVIHLDYVVIEQKPAPTIVAISEGVLAAFHAQKEAIANPAEMNNRAGVPSRGAEDIGRR